MSWICPKCDKPLDVVESKKKEAGTLTCENTHCYDKAKQGYYNLLLAHHKSSKLPGDNAHMINARHTFLTSGFYKPLVDAIEERINTHSLQDISLLDSGCGEGYYARALVSGVLNAKNIDCYSIDISKTAIKKAAVAARPLQLKNKQLKFAVASAFRIPLASASIDFALSVFSPFCEKEMARVLARQGKLIRVLPGPKHLFELKNTLYDVVCAHDSPKPLNSMHLVDQTQVTFSFSIPNQHMLDALVGMTPFNWKTKSTDPPRLSRITNSTITADFVVQVFAGNQHD